MRLFLDSANLDDIAEAVASGAISGATTNPSIMAKEPKTDFVKHCRKIAGLLGNRPLSVEVFATEPDAMVKEALELNAQIGYPFLNIKIPVSWANLHVIKELSGTVPINATCIFTETQAIAAANAGARYVSYFINRMRDLGLDPLRSIQRTREILAQRGTICEIICGSIRSARDISDCIMAGAHIVTAGLSQLKSLCDHPGTDRAITQFTSDFATWLEQPAK